jgi:hypothetical protein
MVPLCNTLSRCRSRGPPSTLCRLTRRLLAVVVSAEQLFVPVLITATSPQRNDMVYVLAKHRLTVAPALLAQPTVARPDPLAVLDACTTPLALYRGRLCCHQSGRHSLHARLEGLQLHGCQISVIAARSLFHFTRQYSHVHQTFAMRLHYPRAFRNIYASTSAIYLGS